LFYLLIYVSGLKIRIRNSWAGRQEAYR